MRLSEYLVSPAEIESRLSAIWESLESANKMRASLFNLIIYTPKNERAIYIHKVAERMIERFPSRVLLITIDPDPAENYLKTKVSVMSSADIACDFIDIEVAGEYQNRVPFLLLPHLIPDLPIYLVWAEDPIKQNPLFDPLAKISTRVIFDSEVTEHLPKFAKMMLSHKERFTADIADLNWGRLESFRDAISATFYHPEKQNVLQDIQSLQITYNVRPTPFTCHMKIQALYLQGWLAAQLGWNFQSLKETKEAITLQYAQGITATLTPQTYPDLLPSIILSATIVTKSGETYFFERDPKVPNEISVTISTKDFCWLPAHFIFSKEDSGQSLVREICRKGTSSHYLKLLSQIIKIGESSSLC